MNISLHHERATCQHYSGHYKFLLYQEEIEIMECIECCCCGKRLWSKQYFSSNLETKEMWYIPFKKLSNRDKLLFLQKINEQRRMYFCNEPISKIKKEKLQTLLKYIDFLK